MHDRFELARARLQFARLLKLSQAQEKALVDDPRPFLIKAYGEIARHRQMLDDIKAAASGSDQLTCAPPTPPVYQTIESVLMGRLRRIQEILERAEL